MPLGDDEWHKEWQERYRKKLQDSFDPVERLNAPHETEEQWREQVRADNPLKVNVSDEVDARESPCCNYFKQDFELNWANRFRDAGFTTFAGKIRDMEDCDELEQYIESLAQDDNTRREVLQQEATLDSSGHSTDAKLLVLEGFANTMLKKWRDCETEFRRASGSPAGWKNTLRV